MAKKKLTPEQEKEIALLKASNEMFLKTKEEAKIRGTKEAVDRIETARRDVIAQMMKIDPEEASKADKGHMEDEISYGVSPMKMSDTVSVFDILDRYNAENEKEEVVNVEDKESIVMEATQESSSQVSSSNFHMGPVNSDVQYDIISLPSNGQCYPNKVDRLPVGYLTAYDENLITSPNLYKDGLIIDFLLKHKVLDDSINLDNLCLGDVDAIILFLRATSYGPEFPITARDPQSGEEIETVVDLTQFKSKEFNLKGDDNGHFDYQLPISKDNIKFKFLTRKDEKMLKILSEIEEDGVKAHMIRQQVQLLSDAIKSDKVLDGKTKHEYLKDMEKYKDWSKKLESKGGTPYSRIITNRLELSIMSVNGNSDRAFISKYVKNMGAMDSLSLRRYILENEPGINFEIEVERPLSLGGGSFKTFLEWDDAVFLNIA